MTQRLLEAHEVADLIGVTTPTVWAYTSRKILPPATKHVGRTPVWDRRVIVAWMAVRYAERLPLAELRRIAEQSRTMR